MSVNIVQALNNLSASLAGLTTAPNIVSAIDEITAALTTIGSITSGTYQPASTALVNMTVVTPAIAQFMRVGSVVVVSGICPFTPTIAGAASFELSLPIATVFSVAFIQLAGTINGSQPVADSEPAQIFASGNNTAAFNFVAVTGNASSCTYIYSYQVLP